MTYYKDTKLIHLSTRSQSGRIMNNNINDKSDMVYNIPNMIDLTDTNLEYCEFSIDYAIIPISFYNINTTNNTFSIQYFAESSNGALASTVLYTIPVGNYSALSLASWITNNIDGMTMSFNSVSSIFTLTSIVQTFRVYSLTSDYIFGYTSTISSGTWDSVNSNAVLIFSRMCNFLPTPRINIRCSELGCGRMVSAVNSDEVCCIIPNTARPNQQIVYINTAGVKSLVKCESMNTFRIRITDDDNNLLQFNGVASFFNLRFDFYYKTLPKIPSFRNIVNTVAAENYRRLLIDIENRKKLL